MISKLARIFGSKTKAQEILLLVAGLKPVVRQGFYEYELPQVEQFCKENEIYLVNVSNYCFSLFKFINPSDKITVNIFA